MAHVLWQVQERDSIPIIALALHAGHSIREELTPLFAIDEASRLREEDPYTEIWAKVVDTWVVINRSRFEVDLNRPRERAVYRVPNDAWGLRLWKKDLPLDVVDRSLAIYDDFYAHMHGLFQRMERRFHRFVVLDIHSYNHRRKGPDHPPANPQQNPEVIVGTGTMNRQRWASIVERFIADLRAFTREGHHLDVRENIKFHGGNFAAWCHATFPHSACVLSIEFKKTFMDEWTGTANDHHIQILLHALQTTIPGILETLEQLRQQMGPQITTL